MIAELAVETSISPTELLDVEPELLAAMVDVLEERARELKK